MPTPTAMPAKRRSSHLVRLQRSAQDLPCGGGGAGQGGGGAVLRGGGGGMLGRRRAAARGGERSALGQQGGVRWGGAGRGRVRRGRRRCARRDPTMMVICAPLSMKAFIGMPFTSMLT